MKPIRSANDIQRRYSNEKFYDSGIIINAYHWHIWKRAFDMGVNYAEHVKNNEKNKKTNNKKDTKR